MYEEEEDNFMDNVLSYWALDSIRSESEKGLN
jgi:hypothetical protein